MPALVAGYLEWKHGAPEAEKDPAGTSFEVTAIHTFSKCTSIILLSRLIIVLKSEAVSSVFIKTPMNSQTFLSLGAACLGARLRPQL